MTQNGAIVAQTPTDTLKFIESFECTDEERHALCHGNAERVFHIDPA